MLLDLRNSLWGLHGYSRRSFIPCVFPIAKSNTLLHTTLYFPPLEILPALLNNRALSTPELELELVWCELPLC